MPNAVDAAAFLVQVAGEKDVRLTRKSLQKLLYYANAFSLAWDGEPLFNETIEAWEHGPVVRAVWDVSVATETGRKSTYVSSWPWGSTDALSPAQRETVIGVVESLGHLDGEQLSDLTHREPPWLEARSGLSSNASSNRPIDAEIVRKYFASLGGKEHKRVPEASVEAMLHTLEFTPEQMNAIRNPQWLSESESSEWLARLASAGGLPPDRVEAGAGFHRCLVPTTGFRRSHRRLDASHWPAFGWRRRPICPGL